MIVDNDQILCELKAQYMDSESIVIPVYSDVKKHRVFSRVSLLYIYIIDTQKEFIIPVNHSDKVFNITDLTFINNDKLTYTYSSGIQNAVNIDALYYFSTSTSIKISELYTAAHTYYYNRCWKLDNINDIIPLLKHKEYCTKIKDIILPILHLCKEPGFREYNEVMLPQLKQIESAGLYTVDSTLEYTKYNPWSITGRPSNAFNGINYAALNKDDQTRERYVSRFDDGKLVEFDYDAYHLRLIADIIDYELPDTSIHAYLGKYYFDKEMLTEDEYSESKSITFKILYGGIPAEFENIPFFSHVKKYIFRIWDIYKKNGYIETPLFKRKIYRDNLKGRDIKPQTLFNYIIQAVETEQNIGVIKDVHAFLSDKQSKLILYTYDALLFDIHPAEGNILVELAQLMKFPVKCKTGRDYKNIKTYDFKLLR